MNEAAPAPVDPLHDAGEFFVRYVEENVERWPALLEAVAGFDAGQRPAAQAAEAFLKGIDVAAPLESLTRLYLVDGNLVGFYSLANGEVTLSSRRRKKLGLAFPRQPAVVVTWIAKSAIHPCDGLQMVRHATRQARKAAELSAATLLALDPFDAETADMWRTRHRFIDGSPPREGALPRLVVPLQAPPAD